MTIRGMTRKDTTDGAAIWLSVFGDSAAFTDWFFRDRFCPEYAFAAFDGDRMAAMTLGRPTRILVEGKPREALLISGVSTLPAYRGKGLMHALLSEQIRKAKASGFSCCYLHPVSETLYASLGFRNGTEALLIGSDPDRTHRPYNICIGTDIAAMRAVYDALLPDHDGMQIRDDEELRALLSDYGADGYCMFTAYEEGELQGYIIVLKDDTVPELFALCPSAYEALLDEAALRTGKKLKALVPTDCGVEGERLYSMQYLVFDDAFSLPLKNGFCRLSY